MKTLKKAISALFVIPTLIIFGIFTASNTQYIRIKFWPFEFFFEIQLWLAILTSFFIGIILGSFLILISKTLLILNNSRLSSEIKNLKSLIEKKELKLLII